MARDRLLTHLRAGPDGWERFRAEVVEDSLERQRLWMLPTECSPYSPIAVAQPRAGCQIPIVQLVPR